MKQFPWKSVLKVGMLVAFGASSAVTVAGRQAAVAVLWKTPTCGHEKLGQVSTRTGTRVSETTQDTMLPAVDYALALSQLAAAAQAQGGNAVVVRWHKATYSTRNGRRSRKPVHVEMRGAVIRTRGDAGQCGLSIADPVGFEQRTGNGEPVNVSSGDAYSSEP